MSPGQWTVAAVVCAVVLAVLLLVVLAGRRRVGRELATSRADLDALRTRVEELSHQVAERRREDDVAARRRLPEEYVITSVPEHRSGLAVPDEQPDPVRQLTAGEFASVALGESMVRLVSLGYGVRRALSPENRNRIRFEMRREVKRARKQRRRDVKEAKRHLRADQGRQAA
ncbi:MAG: hypothetical protein HOQ22_10990 [Nocardioidaceae bacterium]|nr:hypothetical protein [Nocardioidaceae bacterium]NUS51551.1 hypothetical protein [Nocardioidaceae bacterium]